MNKIKRNVVSQTLCQIVNMVIPFFLSPYISRALGAENLGIYSYRLSIVSYFTLLAMQGMLTYGTKKIAEKSQNPEEQDKMFCHLALVQVTFAGIVMVAYVLFAFLVFDSDVISLIMCLNVACCIFDFHWLFYGKEDFHITTTVNLVARLLYVISIVLFVKTKDDLITYVVIMSLTTVVTNGALLAVIIKRMRFQHFSFPSFQEVKGYVRDNFVLFIPIAAQTVYHVMDKTMLGMLSSFEQTGYYYNADKLISIPISLIAAVCLVLMPRMTAMYHSEKTGKENVAFQTTMQAIACLSSAFCFGIIAVAADFVPLYFGEEFVDCVPIVRLLSVVIILKSVSEGLKTQYLIPRNNNGCIIASVSVGCVVNLIINSVLITKWGAMGAVIGTIAAELVAVFIQLAFVCRREKNYRDVFYGFGFAGIGLLMSVALQYIHKLLAIDSIVISLFVEILIGAAVFALLSVGYCRLTNSFALSKRILAFLPHKKGH